MGLEAFWFCLIAVLWAGYFLLEGFDFGTELRVIMIEIKQAPYAE